MNKIRELTKALIAVILFVGNLFATADVRNITTNPAYLCPGQQFSINFEVKGDLNQNLYMLLELY